MPAWFASAASMGSSKPINAGHPVAITKTHAAATLGFMDTVANRCSDSGCCEILSVWRVDSSGNCRQRSTPHGRKCEVAGSPLSGPLPFCLIARTTAIRNFWEVVLSATSGCRRQSAIGLWNESQRPLKNQRGFSRTLCIVAVEGGTGRLFPPKRAAPICNAPSTGKPRSGARFLPLGSPHELATAQTSRPRVATRIK